MSGWKDCTSYSKSDKEGVPKSFAMETQNVRVAITSAHIYHRPNWVMHCHALNMDTVSIASDGTPLEEVKKKALAKALLRARIICEELESACKKN